MKKNTVRYNTNLASEFWVLSALYRIGVDAYLTLGSKKSVDILVLKNSQTTFTVDVKGVADRYDWPADNIRILDSPTHLYIFLSFEGKMSDPLANPSVWIIPSNQVQPFMKRYKTRVVVSRAMLKQDGSKFKNAWHYLSNDANEKSPSISNLSIEEKLLSIFASKHLGETLKRKVIIQKVIDTYEGTNRRSVIPSDYCYNIINKDIAKGFESHIHLFEYLGDNNYKVLGDNFDYEGDITHKGKKIGEWRKGNERPHLYKKIE